MTISATPHGNPAGIVAVMVTTIHKYAKRRLYLREHRKARGVSAPRMADRLGIARESVLRLEREWERCSPTMQLEYAAALDIEVEDLWWPPGQRPMGVFDQIMDGQPEPVKDMARDILSRMVAGQRK